ncbi:MAG: ABC transporter ATP-binding protein [Candidatus Thalassarchaeaceae archaeon]
MSLIVENLSVSFDNQEILTNINLNLGQNEIIAILGPSGCGKTTLLRTISGLQEQNSGKISLQREPIEHVPCEQRGIGMLFQKPVLFPFKDVLGNILFAYQRKEERNMDDVYSILKEMGLEGKEHQTIETLSGGEAQRVVLARALLTNPKLLLLDEPLSALDVDLRRKIAQEMRSTLKARGIPAIHVTHDPAEASIIGDRVIHWIELQPGGADEE